MSRTAAAPAPRFLTTTQAAPLLGLGRVRLWQMCRDGQIPAALIGNRYFIDVDALSTMAREQAAARRATAAAEPELSTPKTKRARRAA